MPTSSRFQSIRQATAFTLIEALVVISIITLLISITLPSLGSARENGRATVCLAQIREIGNATTVYGDMSRDEYPYGVPQPISVIDHPHYNGWNNGARGGGIPPQQQFYSLNIIADPKAYICPTDPHPQNYVWWDYDVHPDLTKGSSYMFSEYALFGIAWQKRSVLKRSKVWQPSTFVWATDGWMCPNGWTWGTTDPLDPVLVGSVRIDWSHLGSINALYGDNHAQRQKQEGARYRLRTHPLENF